MYRKGPMLLILIFVLLSLMISLATAQMVSPKYKSIGWTRMTIKALTFEAKHIQLQHISGGSKNDVFAVGFDEKSNIGVILHYNGIPENTWVEVTLPEQSKKLNAVWGDSGSGVFAVGEGGTILFGYKDKWVSMPVQEPITNLKGIWGISADVFAVGDGGVILHYNKIKSETWRGMVSGIGSNLNSIWGSDTNNIYAVGDGGIVLRYSGKKWETKLEKKEYGNLRGVWGSGNNIFAVGDNGNILHSKDGGNNWTHAAKKVTENNLNGIWGIFADTIYAVGNNGTVLHYNGKEWSEMLPRPKADEEKNLNLYAVWVSQNPHVFIGGEAGFSSYYAEYGIEGYVFNMCTGGIIQGAKVKVWDNNQWVDKPNNTTSSQGYYGDIELDSDIEKLQFSASGFNTEEKEVRLPRYKLAKTETFLLPNDDFEYCVAGIISALCGTYYYCPIQGVKVNLYKANGCEFPPTTNVYVTTDASGHYSFPNVVQSGEGIYKVEPILQGYTFTPQYPSLPLTLPTAYDFTPSQ